MTREPDPIPQRDLLRDLRVLIDQRLDLERAIHQLVLRELVDDSSPYSGKSQRAASQAIMFSRWLGVMGSMEEDSGSAVHRASAS